MNQLSYLTESALNQFIESALLEDIGDGDHSSLASINEHHLGAAHLLVKSSGILAGVVLAERIFHTVDPQLQIELLRNDGEAVSVGDVAFVVRGKARSILSAERLVLNCMQRMSGIATYTRYLNSLISGTGARLLDTRKTTPNFRLPEKWAVVIGGGTNHRFGLFDMIMLKDNHIDYAGGIAEAIKATKDYLQQNDLDLKIEVETRNLDEVRQVLETGGVHRILLDNMSPSQLKQAVQLIDGRMESEASGGITEETIVEIAKTGVDFISVGALTHSVTSLDLSLKAL